MIALSAMGAMNLMGQTEEVLFCSDNTKKYPYRIPAITTMNNGEVIAITDYRPGGKDVGNGVDVDIYARISSDNGGNWTGTDTPHDDTSDFIKIAEGSSSLAFGDAAVAAHPTTGEVLVLSVGAGSTPFTSATASTNDYFCYRHYSDDYGRTWNSHTNITSKFREQLETKTLYAMFFASGRLLVSKHTSGRIYGALLTKESGGTYNYVFYTEDFGLNWTLLGDDYAIEKSADEAKVEELPNGDILISSRTTGGRIFNVYSMTNKKWGTQQTYTFASDCKATNGELMLYQGVNAVDNTTQKASSNTVDILLQSLPVGSSREDVTVYYKEVANTTYATSDIATDWAKGLLIYDGKSAYSAMTVMADEKIGFLYEKDYYSSNFNDNYKYGYASGGTANIVFRSLTVEEITGNAYTLKASAPTLTASCEFEGSMQVEMSCETSDVAIYYTTDGTEPTTSSSVYDGAITISATTTIKAIAARNGYSFSNSDVATATYALKETATPIEPTFSLSATTTTLTVGGTTQLTLTTNSDGAVTYTSSNTAVATVNANGVVTAVGAGTVTITANVAATSQYKAASATCEITVKAKEAKSYTLKPLTGLIGTTTFNLVTFSATEAVTLPSGVKAYYVKETDDAGAKLARLSGSVIPANTGVILLAENSGDITLEVTTATGSAATGNLLVGTLDDVNPVLSNTDYILAVKGPNSTLAGKFAFCQLTDNYTVENYANRAYLSLTTTATRSITLSFDDEEGGTTAIDEVESPVDTPAEYYTLQGVKVEADQLTPGIYIMKHHGKTRKVVF